MGQSKKTINRPIFERRRKEHNIVFADECPPDQWPDEHRDVFEAIEKFKHFRYATYATRDTDEDTAPHPWKADAKLQARRLVDKAKDLVSRNEPTWRLGCEPLVFSRLAAEVACKRCRQRVWRSEIEASLPGRDSASRTLRARQQTRDRCRCPMTTRPDIEDERVGLNRLFVDRSDDFVIHPPELAKQLPQEQKPDRIYGLRQTRIIEDLLLKELPNGSFLEDMLHKQPHSTTGQALLFPFLVVEAKSGTAPDDWHSIQLQTAFPIYTYLNTQQSLRLATGQRSKWMSGPLVWFFMSKGDDWRLCLAYQSPAGSPTSSSRPNHTTNIATVWTGCITNRDAALQLFLIVDYLSDWARDVYRAAVIRELRVLAAPDTEVATVFTDTDVFSTRQVVLDPAMANSSISGTMMAPNHCGHQAAFKNLDTAFGVVRHAAPILSRFMALFLTEDNVRTFVDSTSNNVRQYFIRQIIRQFFFRTVVLTPDEVSSIEKEWTGHSRLRVPFHLQNARFYTIYVVAYSLLPSWDQARDLCLIAVQEQAFDTLVTQSKLKATNLKPSSVRPSSSVAARIALLKNASIEHNLLACIERKCGFLQKYALTRFGDQEPVQVWCKHERSSGALWLLLGYMYKFHKKGDLEPDLPFFRISAATEIQRPAPQNVDSSARLLRFGGLLHSSDQGAVLIHGDAYHHFPDSSKSAICVYLVRDSTAPPDRDELARIIKNSFEDRDVYHTTRDFGTLNIRNMKECQTIWNLERTYGVFFSRGKGSFVKWLRELGKPLPTRQGSPRGPDDTGRIIFERNYSAWTDRRLIHGTYNNMWKRFLKKLFAAEATAWAKIAQKRIRQWNDCCILCATVDADGLFEAKDIDHGKDDDDDSTSTTSSMSYSETSQNGVASTSESDTVRRKTGKRPASIFDRDDPVDEAIIRFLCWDCAENLSTRCYLPEWLKTTIIQALKHVIRTTTGDSAPPSEDPDCYCISTPPRRPLRFSSKRFPDDFRLDATPSDSEVEIEEATREKLETHDVRDGEDQADESPSVLLHSTSPGPSKRTTSTSTGDEGARKRRKRSSK